MCSTAKAVPRGKFISLKDSSKKEGRLKNTELIL
jgi:hypothetical protein